MSQNSCTVIFGPLKRYIHWSIISSRFLDIAKQWIPKQVISKVFFINSCSGISIEHELTVIMGGFSGGPRGPPPPFPHFFSTEFVLFWKNSHKNKMVSVSIDLTIDPPPPSPLTTSEHADTEFIKLWTGTKLLIFVWMLLTVNVM